MPFVMLFVAALQGVIVVGLLLLLQAVVSALVPGWVLPFSPWWGMLFALPGLALAALVRRRR